MGSQKYYLNGDNTKIRKIINDFSQFQCLFIS
jgi:hypothetical protein